jgi:CDP-diacylglycerol--glycerol-3-phosphate 3-phosphatidyltransferase
MWRKTRGLPVYTLPQALHRRAWAGFQMGFLVVALWPLFYPPVTSLAGFAFMLPVLIGFAIDWLIVSGHINRQTEEVDLFFRRLTNFSQTVLQPAMRIVIVILLTVSLAQSGVPPLSGEGASLSSVIHSSGFVLAALLIILGIAGRVISLAMLGLLGWYYIEIPLQSIDYVLFCSVVWLMLLGTGRFSLWLEDDHWINRYDGL